MLVQLIIGTVLLLVSIIVAGLSYWIIAYVLHRSHDWLMRSPHRPKLMLVLCVAAVWAMAQMTVAVWIWAIAFVQLGALPTLEEAVYFALVAFTTLGFGDVLLPEDWRLLGGLAAANGLLNIGLVTAILLESLRDLRGLQIAALDETE
ncbi:ion channel [Yoonia sp. 208BN28-4]|uniref:ion channel n=1 Tax=Yoonia sp. 208BN28-4 TaxID=3126505 RepID=UPI0030A2FAB6